MEPPGAPDLLEQSQDSEESTPAACPSPRGTASHTPSAMPHRRLDGCRSAEHTGAPVLGRRQGLEESRFRI